MRTKALFINGVHEGVLEEIIETQKDNPDQILFLQPYSGRRIAELHRSRPTISDPMRLYLSTTKPLEKVAYIAEIVGWDDKREIPKEQRIEIARTQAELQKGETFFEEQEQMIFIPNMVNLIHVRRMSKLDDPFPVSDLVKISDGKPLSTNRTRAGGWSYVHLID